MTGFVRGCPRRRRTGPDAPLPVAVVAAGTLLCRLRTSWGPGRRPVLRSTARIRSTSIRFAPVRRGGQADGVSTRHRRRHLQLWPRAVHRRLDSEFGRRRGSSITNFWFSRRCCSIRAARRADHRRRRGRDAARNARSRQRAPRLHGRHRPRSGRICREHLTAWHRGAFDDPRVDLRFADGRAHVERRESLRRRYRRRCRHARQRAGAESLHSPVLSTAEAAAATGRDRRGAGAGVLLPRLQGACRARRTLSTAFAESTATGADAVVPRLVGIPYRFRLAAGRIDARRAHRRGDRPQARTGVADSTSTARFSSSRFAHDRETRFLLSLPGPVLEDGVAVHSAAGCRGS